jgi:hypothetical protein
MHVNMWRVSVMDAHTDPPVLKQKYVSIQYPIKYMVTFHLLYCLKMFLSNIKIYTPSLPQPGMIWHDVTFEVK